MYAFICYMRFIGQPSLLRPICFTLIIIMQKMILSNIPYQCRVIASGYINLRALRSAATGIC